MRISIMICNSSLNYSPGLRSAEVSVTGLEDVPLFLDKLFIVQPNL